MDLIISDKNVQEIKQKQNAKLIEEVRSVRYRAITALSYLDLASDERTKELFTQLAELLTTTDSVLKELSSD